MGRVWAGRQAGARYTGNVQASPPSRARSELPPISSPRAPIGRRVTILLTSTTFATKADSSWNPLTRPTPLCARSTPQTQARRSPCSLAPTTACISSHGQSIATPDSHRHTGYQATTRSTGTHQAPLDTFRVSPALSTRSQLPSILVTPVTRSLHTRPPARPIFLPSDVVANKIAASAYACRPRNR